METTSYTAPAVETNLNQPTLPTLREQKFNQALQDFSHWRVNKKKPAEPIPHKLWHQIFELEDWYTPSELRSFFSVSTKQYSSKKEALGGRQNLAIIKESTYENTKNPLEVTEDYTPQFCEAKLKNETKASPKSNVKSKLYALEPLPSAKTLVVEFCRHDGQIMKIHTTQDSIPTLLQTFLGGEAKC